MTQKEIAKAAFAEAENDARQKQIAEVKKIVTKTLEKLDLIKKDIKDLQEIERLLKLDIDDLKEGKLERIAERQEKDKKAKDNSVVIIIKEKEVVHDYNPWYVPYRVIWQEPSRAFPLVNYTLCDNAMYGSSGIGITTNNAQNWASINCSVAKDSVAGAYDISGHVVHLR